MGPLYIPHARCAPSVVFGDFAPPRACGRRRSPLQIVADIEILDVYVRLRLGCGWLCRILVVESIDDSAAANRLWPSGCLWPKARRLRRPVGLDFSHVGRTTP